MRFITIQNSPKVVKKFSMRAECTRTSDTLKKSNWVPLLSAFVLNMI